MYGCMGRDCANFYSKLAEMLSDKRKQSKSLTVNWLRIKICFGSLKFCILCLRGSRSIKEISLKLTIT